MSCPIRRWNAAPHTAKPANTRRTAGKIRAPIKYRDATAITARPPPSTSNCVRSFSEDSRRLRSNIGRLKRRGNRLTRRYVEANARFGHYAASENQNVNVAHYERMIGIAMVAHDRLAAQVEAGVDHHRAAGQL